MPSKVAASGRLVMVESIARGDCVASSLNVPEVSTLSVARNDKRVVLNGAKQRLGFFLRILQAVRLHGTHHPITLHPFQIGGCIRGRIFHSGSRDRQKR